MAGSQAAYVRPALWTPAFVALCVTVALGYAHYALVLPTIPLYVDENGGTALFAGLAILSFSVPSFAVRPFFGRLADSWSPAGVLTIGLLLLTLGGLIYLSGILALIFAAAVLRGFGWAGINTGGYTLLANAAPDTRRGEASGYYTSATASVVVLFPAIALWLIARPSLGFTSVFLLAIGTSGAGMILSHLVLSSLAKKREPAAASTTPAPTGLAALFEPSVLPATALNLCSNLAFPAVTAFLPLYARELGIGDVAIFYILAGVGSALIRPILGGKSDSIGRGVLIGGGFVLQLIGFLLVLVAEGLGIVLLGGVLAALGNAINGSATTALAMDLAPPERRGKAMATFSMSFQMGQGFGAIIAGALADSFGLRSMYAGSMGLIVIGFVVLFYTWRGMSRSEQPGEAAA